MQGHQARDLGLDALHGPREGVPQALDHLEQRQVDIAERAADQVLGALRIAGQHPLEIAEVLGRAGLEEAGGPALRLGLLVFVIEAGGDRVVGVVDLGDQVGHRQLQLVRPESAGLVRGRQT